VDTSKAEMALKSLLRWVNKTLPLRNKIGTAMLESGYFANVIDIGCDVAIAISTDGVGTKILVAQMMDKYDTIGIDCVAMNVNDILCVGAEPIAMVDYVAVQAPEPKLLEEIGKGLYEGARLAKITIPAGEIAQVREMIKGVRDNFGFDLVGTCIGTVSPEKVIVGQDIREGDVVLGLRSSGIHSNGLSLAREVFFDKKGFGIDKHFEDLGKTIGEELLEPTRIYVSEIMDVLKAGLNTKALIHITGDGFLNLTRVESEVGYVIDRLPELQPIFSLIQRFGEVTDEEMYQVYNMGIGFCLVISEEDVDKARDILKKHNVECYRIGRAVTDKEKKVIIEPKRLIGKNGQFYRY
jgi:phosphoribosylformylglycinamidine cyclo-ligase